MSSVVVTPDPATGTILVNVEQTLARDLFTRVVASGWGTATTGQTWANTGGAAGDYSVNGTQGLHTFATVNTPRQTVIRVGTDDHGVATQVTIAVAALTQPIQPAVILRYTDASNYYFAELSLAPSGAVTLLIRKVVGGTTSTLTTSDVLPQSHSAGATWNIMADVCGTTLRAKAWRSTVNEPDWITTTTDFDLVTGGSVGVRSVLATGNSNGSTVFAYDNFVTWISQPVRLWRVTPDNTRTEVRGSPFYTAAPTAVTGTGTAIIWDGEAPFDTRLRYELTSACNLTPLVTGGGTLDSNGTGWLRDPQVPANNIQIAFSDLQFNQCDRSQRVELTRWDPRVYPNASGIHDVLDDSRVRTVAMKRKKFESGIGLATKTLEDVDALEALCLPGRVLMLSLPASFGFGRPYNSDYIAVLDLVQDPANKNDYTSTSRLWEVPFRLSNPPVDVNEYGTGSNGIGGGGATYGDMTASAIGVTYGTTTATGLTYGQLAQGEGY